MSEVKKYPASGDDGFQYDGSSAKNYGVGNSGVVQSKRAFSTARATKQTSDSANDSTFISNVAKAGHEYDLTKMGNEGFEEMDYAATKAASRSRASRKTGAGN